MSKFHNYSFNNTLLIAMQKPDASLVAGFSAWKNNFERNVMKGQKGIKIIAPSPYKVKQEMQENRPAHAEARYRQGREARYGGKGNLRYPPIRWYRSSTCRRPRERSCRTLR